jgi:hypothetical protein
MLNTSKGRYAIRAAGPAEMQARSVPGIQILRQPEPPQLGGCGKSKGLTVAVYLQVVTTILDASLAAETRLRYCCR